MSIDERIARDLRRHVPDVDENAAWTRIESALPARRRYTLVRFTAVSVGAVAAVVLGVALALSVVSSPPVAGPQSPITGMWVSTDLDGSNQTMNVEVSSDGIVAVTINDDSASVCSGSASTIVGQGPLEGGNQLVIPRPVLTCDDGTIPQASSGPSLESQLLDLTFTYDPNSDTLADSLGSLWIREGTEPTPTGNDSTLLWPQSTLEAVEDAQRLADAGDTGYTWQLEPSIEARLQSGDPDIFDRFLREELGWEQFTKHTDRLLVGSEVSVIYIRCAPGIQNSVYPDDPIGGMCTPTDGLSYEVLEVTVTQPVRQGRDGIWVVSRTETYEPFQQVIPLPRDAADELLTGFLEARIAGDGAEEFFVDNDRGQLLYSTSEGAAFERFEFQQISEPAWPDTPRKYEVRMFADSGQTVVTTVFGVAPDATGKWGVQVYSDTSENGESLADELYEILGGEVMFFASPFWNVLHEPTFGSEGMWEDAMLWWPGFDGDSNAVLRILADPLTSTTGCDEGPPATSIESLAANIASLPGFEASEPVSATVGGSPALQMDLVKTGSVNTCDPWLRLAVLDGIMNPEESSPTIHWRVYLVELPGGSAQILSIAITAPEAIFESVVEKTRPTIESFSFHIDPTN